MIKELESFPPETISTRHQKKWSKTPKIASRIGPGFSMSWNQFQIPRLCMTPYQYVGWRRKGMHSTSPQTGTSLSDKECIDRFKKGGEWGLLTSIDLRDCDPEKIRSKEAITQFSIDLCDYIDMKRFGDPIVVRFGSDPRVQGYSLAQLIETSLVSGHFVEETDRAFIDVFSCKEYAPKKTAEFCQKYFGAHGLKYTVAFRT